MFGLHCPRPRELLTCENEVVEECLRIEIGRDTGQEILGQHEVTAICSIAFMSFLGLRLLDLFRG